MMLITFGIHLYEKCTNNVFLICLVYFQNCSNKTIKKKSLWFQNMPLSKYPYLANLTINASILKLTSVFLKLNAKKGRK